MINDTFIQSPKYQDYLDDKSEISEESVVFIEEEGKEKLIEHDKEFNFVPSNGTEGLVLTQGENGPEWKDVDTPEVNLDDYYTKEEVDNILFTEGPDTNGYDFVDLGLPSGNLWATRNVGATSDEDAGDLFAWGETENKFECNKNNYKFYSNNSYIKYNNEDNLKILELEDDAAHVNMGGSWRMPTKEDFEELINYTDYSENKLVSKINKNFIVIPRLIDYDKAGNADQFETGFGIITLWTSNLYNIDIDKAISYNKSPSNYVEFYDYRYLTKSVRGIIKNLTKSPKYLTKQEADETYATKDDLSNLDVSEDKLKEAGFVTFDDVFTDSKNGVVDKDYCSLLSQLKYGVTINYNNPGAGLGSCVQYIRKSESDNLILLQIHYLSHLNNSSRMNSNQMNVEIPKVEAISSEELDEILI